MSAKTKHIIYAVSVFLALCITFYMLCPKYYFSVRNTGSVIRCNRITGGILLYRWNSNIHKFVRR